MAVHSDDVLLDALARSRGDDRTVLVGALGDAHGDRGPEVLRRIVEPLGGEDVHTRAVAVWALARRSGAEDTLVYAAALRDRSVEVQLAAADALAEHGDRRAAPELFAWLVRKLRRQARMNTWDPTEVPSALRFADRNDLLRQVAETLMDHVHLLHEDERSWLDEVWPAMERNAGPGGEPVPPYRERLAKPMYDDGYEPDPEEAALEDEHVRHALDRARS